MSGKWERTFEVSVPVERVWRAFTDPAEQVRLAAPPGAPPDPNARLERKVLEVVPMRRLRWAQEGGTLPERSEFTVVFESREHGARFTVTRVGFSEGEDADVFSESNGLGFEQGFRDLVLYLETGVVPHRHYFGCSASCTGMVYAERAWGVVVLRVTPGSFAAEVGLERGDRLLRIGRAPIYCRADVWLLTTEHDPGTELEVEFVRRGEHRRGSGRLSALGARVVGE
jgi:uncharacterized protein YndB with AHSA1/START domain